MRDLRAELTDRIPLSLRKRKLFLNIDARSTPRDLSFLSFLFSAFPQPRRPHKGAIHDAGDEEEPCGVQVRVSLEEAPELLGRVEEEL